MPSLLTACVQVACFVLHALSFQSAYFMLHHAVFSLCLTGAACIPVSSDPVLDSTVQYWFGHMLTVFVPPAGCYKTIKIGCSARPATPLQS